MDQGRNDEIDLFLFLKKLWDGKWKIIFFIFIFFTISLVYIANTPDTFSSTTILRKGNHNVYSKFKYLNDILVQETIENTRHLRTDPTENDDNQQYLEIDISRVLQVDEKRIFDMFFNEFRDYDEMITILSKNEYVQDKIKNLNDKEKRKSLVNFAKKFTIIKPKSDNEDWKISFIWRQINEGNLLIKNALKLTLINVQKSLLMEVDNIAKSIDLKNQLYMNHLNIKLQSIKKLSKLIKARKISFLTEQSNIAKELGIEKNQMININILRSNQAQKIDNKFYQIENYFLRGYKAINREIEIIRNRSSEDNNLMTDGYIQIQEKLINVRDDNRSNELRDAINIVKNDNIANWINFNVELSEIKNLKNPNLFMFILTIIGAILGSFYVLISSNFNQRK